jgi:ribosomal protein S27AE
VSPLRTLRQIVAPTGRHRGPRSGHGPERLEVPLEYLLGKPWPSPSRPYGAAVTQAWRDCEPCGKATAGVVHADGWTCGECLTTQDGERAGAGQ